MFKYLIENKITDIISKEDFLKRNGISEDDLLYMGEGEFGEAYSIDEKVLKITTSPTEYKFMSEVFKNNRKYSNIVNVYDVGRSKDEYYILMEQVDTDNIEDIFNDMLDVLNSYDYSIADLPYIDIDDEDEFGEVDKNTKQFINQLYNVITDYKNLGVYKMDISPDNLGYDENNILKAFDVDEKR
jgi:serine/threonine protein kinase